jgi:hypothetical protein
MILLSTFTSPVWASTYYLATAAGGGNDSNNGTSANTPWLTPNHSVNCGDVIIAAASSAYQQANFTFNHWGGVTCPAGNNVAWLKCESFDACIITVTSGDGMDLDQSYWGIQGWEVDGAPGAGACFNIYAAAGVQLHHIIFANDIANVCGMEGFDSGANVGAGVGTDYLVVVGSIAYNSAGSSSACYSGIGMIYPVASDSLPGTHVYFAGNFSYDNVDGLCNSGAPTDGQGLFFDSPDAMGQAFPAYTQQMVMDNNISVFNGGRGLQVFQNSAGAAHARVYLRHNTAYGNNKSSSVSVTQCAEILIQNSYAVEIFQNLAVTAAATGCNGHTLYPFYMENGNGTDFFYSNFGYSATSSSVGVHTSPGFSAVPSSIFSTNPSLANPVDPGAPNCRGASSVPNCMATVIANFKPTTAAAIPYGYQVPSPAQTNDPLFPQWLCNVNLPAGLVTMGCLAQSSVPASPTITGVKVQ